MSLQLKVLAVLVSVLAASAGLNLYYHFRVGSLKETNELLTASLEQARQNAEAYLGSSARWRTAHSDMRARYDQLQAEGLRQRQQNEAAVEKARQARRDAEATLRSFMERYASAYRNSECAPALETRICEELQ